MRKICMASQLIFISIIICSCKSSSNIVSSQNNTSEVVVSTQEVILASTSETESSVLEPVKKSSFNQSVKIYKYIREDKNMSINQVGVLMLEMVLNDAGKQSDEWTFSIVEYKDLKVNFFTLDADGYHYIEPSENEKKWTLDATTNVRFIGELSPIGYSDGNPIDKFWLINMSEWILLRDGDEFQLIPN